MTYVLCCANQKGGCSKTSTTINLAWALTKLGKKVLTIDFDPQASLTLNLGIKNDYYDEDDDLPEEEIIEPVPTIDELLRDAYFTRRENLEYDPLSWDNVKRYIVTPTYKKSVRSQDNKMEWKEIDAPYGFDCMPGYIELSVVEMTMGIASGASRSSIKLTYLSKIIDVIKENDNYDYILIDTPPSLNGLTCNAIAAAEDGIIIVSALDVMSTRGISRLIGIVKTIENLVKPDKPNFRGTIGIVMSLYSSRRVVDRDMDEWSKKFLPVPVFDTKIPESIASFKRANADFLLASQLDKKVETAFISLANEIIDGTENPDKKIGSAKEKNE